MANIKTIDYENEYKDELNEINKAANKGDLIIFIGAGVSKLKGAPSWMELSNKFLKHLFYKNAINHSKLNYLEKQENPRKLLSMCKIIEQTKLDKKQWFNIQNAIENNSPDENLKECKDVYNHLYKINAGYITTNFDSFLDQVTEDSKLIDDSSLNKDKPLIKPKIYLHYEDINTTRLITNGDVFHIHGSVRDERDLVLTTTDYLKAYNKHPDNKRKRSSLPDFLSQIFVNKTVIFIGYSLEEDFILEHILDENYVGGQRHFIIYPFLNNDHKEFEKEYFKQLGINLIHFNIAEYGYQQLYYEIIKFSELVHSQEKNVLDKIPIVERLL